MTGSYLDMEGSLKKYPPRFPGYRNPSRGASPEGVTAMRGGGQCRRSRIKPGQGLRLPFGPLGPNYCFDPTAKTEGASMKTRFPLLLTAIQAAAMLLPLALPRPVFAQRYEAMMPEALQREYKRANIELADLKDRLEVADNEILAIDLQDPEAKETAEDAPLFKKRKELLSKQANLVRQAVAKQTEVDRLRRLLAAKRREYRSVD
jgi:hypothetical protein